MNPVWPTKKLGELLQGRDSERVGRTVKIKKTDYQGSGRYPVIDQGVNLISGYIDDESKLYKGKLPVAIFGDHTRIFKFIDFKFAIGADGTKILQPKEGVLIPKYFYYALLGLFVENLGYKRHFSILRRKQILLPPLKIQHQIVKRLDTIRKAQELNDKQIVLGEELFQSLMQKELDRKGKHWEVRKLGEVCKIKGGKRVPRGEQLSDTKTNHPYIRVVDFKDFSVDLSDLKYIDHKIFEKIKNYTVRGEDIYISIAGTTGLVGIIPKALDGANLTENAAKLIVERKNETDKWYLVYFLSSNFGQNQIKISTYAPGVPKLALYRIEKIKIPLPPFETQRQIVAKLQVVQDYKKKLFEQKQKLQELFSSCLNKAMKRESII